jgi:hypothetical protein
LHLVTQLGAVVMTIDSSPGCQAFVKVVIGNLRDLHRGR